MVARNVDDTFRYRSDGHVVLRQERFSALALQRYESKSSFRVSRKDKLNGGIAQVADAIVKDQVLYRWMPVHFHCNQSNPGLESKELLISQSLPSGRIQEIL